MYHSATSAHQLGLTCTKENGRVANNMEGNKHCVYDVMQLLGDMFFFLEGFNYLCVDAFISDSVIVLLYFFKSFQAIINHKKYNCHIIIV